MVRPTPDGGGTVSITPTDIQTAATTFGKAQDDISAAWTTLQTALDNNAGMAGDDHPAQTFAGKYNRAVAAAWKALHAACMTVGGISTGLTQTANNAIRANHHSSVQANGSPPLLTPYPVFADIVMADPPSPTGPGETVWYLPGPLEKFWPNAHTDKVRAVATAWHTMANTIGTSAGRCQSALTALEVNDSTTTAIQEFWSAVYTQGNPTTVLAGAQGLCQALGDACDKYASAIDSKRSHVHHLLIGAGVAVGLTTALGIGLTIFTGGASDEGAGIADVAEVEGIVGDVAAETAATVESEVGAVITGDLVTTVETAAEQAPAVESVEAETIQVEADLEKPLEEAAGETVPPAGTGPLTPSQAQNAIMQAERTGSGLKADAWHRAASFAADQIGSDGTVTEITGGDGVTRTLVQVPGEVNGVPGRFEWILDGDTVTHQMFVRNGTINGIPIKP